MSDDINDNDIQEKYDLLKGEWISFLKIFESKEEGINSLSEYTSALEEMGHKHPEQKVPVSFVYRGEGKTYPTLFQPMILRINNKLSPYKNLHITEYEVNEIRRFQQSTYGKLFLKFLNIDSADWVYLAQHYNNHDNIVTRLLDVTKNPLVALYWACSNEKHHDKDGWVFMIRGESLRWQSIPLDEHSSKKDMDQFIPESFLELFEDNSVESVPPLTPTLLEPINQSTVDRRLRVQSGAFIWWHPLQPWLSKSNIRSRSFVLLINKNAKAQIKKDLETIYNIHHTSLMVEDTQISTWKIVCNTITGIIKQNMIRLRPPRL